MQDSSFLTDLERLIRTVLAKNLPCGWLLQIADLTPGFDTTKTELLAGVVNGCNVHMCGVYEVVRVATASQDCGACCMYVLSSGSKFREFPAKNNLENQHESLSAW
jgi:hypothetical protein